MEQLMRRGLEFLDDHEGTTTTATPATCVVRIILPYMLFSFQRSGFPRSCERFLQALLFLESAAEAHDSPNQEVADGSLVHAG